MKGCGGYEGAHAPRLRRCAPSGRVFWGKRDGRSGVASEAENDLLHVVGQYADEVAHEGYPGDVLHVPPEGYLFQTHDNDTGG